MRMTLDMAEISEDIVSLDKRLINFTQPQINKIIDDGFAEICTVMTPFAGYEIIDLQDQSCSELNVELNKYVIDVYDLYLAKERELYPIKHDVDVVRDTKQIYRDQANVGLVHINIADKEEDTNYAIVKYFYIPTHESENVKVHPQLNRVLDYAFAAAAYDRLHDVERSEQKRAGLNRVAKTTIYNKPEDFEYKKDSMFPSGV